MQSNTPRSKLGLPQQQLVAPLLLEGRPRHPASSALLLRSASIWTWEYRECMARETCATMFLISSSPAPASESSYQRVAIVVTAPRFFGIPINH